MESVSGSDVRLLRVGTVGLGHRARQEFARGRSQWCGGAGAWHIPARHRMTWHCDTVGAQEDNFGSQCGPAVRKKPHFTHGRGNLRGDVSGKRFNTHVMERNVARIGEGQCGNDKWMESE